MYVSSGAHSSTTCKISTNYNFCIINLLYREDAKDRQTDRQLCRQMSFSLVR